MPRNILYPEGAEQLTAMLPRPVKQGIRIVALRQRQSISQLVTVILEDWLRRRGELPILGRDGQDEAA